MSEETNEGLGDDLKDKAKKVASEASEKASDIVDDIKESANEFADSAKGAAGDMKEEWNKVTADGSNKKLVAGIMGILFGSLGIHKFVLGYTKEGLIQIGITIVTCGAGGIIGFIEGIIYLTKSEEEFYNTYQVGEKRWF